MRVSASANCLPGLTRRGIKRGPEIGEVSSGVQSASILFEVCSGGGLFSMTQGFVVGACRVEMQ